MRSGNQILEQLEGIRNSINLADYQSVDPYIIDEAFLGLLKEWKQTWQSLAPYQNIIQHPRFRREDLANIWADYREIKENIEAVNRQLLGDKVELAVLSNEEPDFLLEELEALLGKFNEEGKLGLLKRKILPKVQKLLLECKVNGRAVRGPEDLQTVKFHLQRESWTKQLTIVMDNYLSQLGNYRRME